MGDLFLSTTGDFLWRLVCSFILCMRFERHFAVAAATLSLKYAKQANKLWFLPLFFCTVWCFQSTKYAFHIHLQICTSSNRALRSSFTFLNFVCLARKSLSDQATAITVSWHIDWETSSKYISRQQTIKGGNSQHQTGLSKVQNPTGLIKTYLSRWYASVCYK